MDITQLILDDHQEQRRLFSILEQVPPEDDRGLGVIWGRLAAFLEVHAEAEERFFYPALLRLGKGADNKRDARDETKDAIKDHNQIRDAVARVTHHPVGSQDWHAAVARANAANSEHMGEEERQGLTDFRRTASVQVRHELALSFAAFEAMNITGVRTVDKDPKTYVDEHSPR